MLYLPHIIIQRHSKALATSSPSLGPPAQLSVAFTLHSSLLPLAPHVTVTLQLCRSAWHPRADPHCCSLAAFRQQI